MTAAQTRADTNGQLDWLVAVDSTIVRAHQHAAGARRTPGGTTESHEQAGLTSPMTMRWAGRGAG